jgi:hypothetical protein
MKKWSLFSALLSLMLVFVAVPLVQIVYANGNIGGSARLRLAESYKRMNKESNEQEVVSCKKDDFKKCLILRYNISGIKPGSIVKIGLHENDCKGPLKEKLEVNKIPVGDGKDGREIRAFVKFTEFPKEKLVICIFEVKSENDTPIGQGVFGPPDKFTAKATVK